jgi:hypothetical protein
MSRPTADKYHTYLRLSHALCRGRWCTRSAVNYSVALPYTPQPLRLFGIDFQSECTAIVGMALL